MEYFTAKKIGVVAATYNFCTVLAATLGPTSTLSIRGRGQDESLPTPNLVYQTSTPCNFAYQALHRVESKAEQLEIWRLV